MDRRGVAWPSLATLARDTGLARRSVYRSLKQAEAGGWIVRERGAGPSGRGGRVTLYHSRDPVSPLPLSRDAKVHGRDRDDTQVGTSCPPEYSSKTKRKLTPELSARESGPTRTELIKAIEVGPAKLVETAGVDDFTTPEARWLLDGLRRAERNLSTTMGHSTGLIREQCPVW